METKKFLLIIVLLLANVSIVFGDRQLSEAEILQILQQLTSQTKKTWIPAGIIEATHQEYRASKTTDLTEVNNRIRQAITGYQNKQNKIELAEEMQKMKLDAIPFNIRYQLSNQYTMTSTETVRLGEGGRFYWETDISSRTDSVKPDKNLKDNHMTEELNLDWNRKRIYAWDGENYTTYNSANHAVIDARASTPAIVKGPLTAGFIPWSYGYYSYDSMTAASPIAVEKIVDGQAQVHLTLNNVSDMRIEFVLDASKNYAVLSCVIETDKANISKQYGNYLLVNNNWVPTNILLERFEAGTNKLLASDLWEFVSVDGNTPGSESFNIEFEDDAWVEYVSSITERPALYRNSATVDTQELLLERLAYAANQGTQRNCATASLKYAISQLGGEAADSQLVELVDSQSGQTSLLAVKQFAQAQGFYCRAVATDIETLKNLEGCQVILYLPSKNHFVVLESIDDKYVRVIDLASNKFYYRTNINFFDMAWPNGTALLVSNTPIAGDLTDIADDDLADITGAAGYTCTYMLQDYNVIFCSYIGGECMGNYVIYWPRYGCETGESGECSTSALERLRYTPCIEDPYNPTDCTSTGTWNFLFMRACS